MPAAVIAPALEALVVPIGSVKAHPDNPRKGNVEGIASSLERFGQVRPILVQASTSYIVAGNHTYQAAKSLRWKTIAAVRVDLSDLDARAYMIADNRWSDVAENDDASLVLLLEQLEAEGALAGTGYEPGDASDLRELLSQMPEAPPPDDPPAGDAPSDGRRPGRVGRERVDVTLTLTADQKETFSAELTWLRGEWGTTGVTETVLRAVTETTTRLRSPEA